MIVWSNERSASLTACWTKRSQINMLAAYLMPLHGETKGRQIAAGLVERFGSLPAAIQARTACILRVEHATVSTAHYVHLLKDILGWLSAAAVEVDQPILSSWTQLIDYCRTQMAYEAVEQFRIFYLDKKNRLIADEVQQTGTVDHTPVYPREVIKRALELGATGIILVHNHPSGETSPSAADVRITREIADVARSLGITLHDHLIVGKSGYTSLRSLNLI